jgi:hypothetical protein
LSYWSVLAPVLMFAVGYGLGYVGGKMVAQEKHKKEPASPPIVVKHIVNYEPSGESRWLEPTMWKSDRFVDYRVYPELVGKC